MISSLRNKSADIGSMAFIDPSNSDCAFVVDKAAAKEGNIKPTIVLSRKDGNKKSSSSFHDQRKGRSFHAGDNEGDPLSGSHRSGQRSTSFTVDDYHGSSHPHGKSTSLHVDDYSGGSRHHHRESTSFHLDESSRSNHRGIRKKKSSSFHDIDGDKFHDDNSRSHRSRRKSSSFHDVDDERDASYVHRMAKSKSFHNQEHTRRRLSYMSEESPDEYDRSNKSIDILDKRHGGGHKQSGGAGARFHSSEPVVSARVDYPESNSRRGRHSRRHSAEVTSRPRSRSRGVMILGKKAASYF